MVYGCRGLFGKVGGGLWLAGRVSLRQCSMSGLGCVAGQVGVGVWLGQVGTLGMQGGKGLGQGVV